jgi:hypothetical protein
MLEMVFAYFAGLFTIPALLVALFLHALVKEAWGDRR